jgi:anaerobic selenocysteine-containing dehydrogenase
LIKVTPRIAQGVSIEEGAWITPDEDGIDIAGCANVLAEDGRHRAAKKAG